MSSPAEQPPPAPAPTAAEREAYLSEKYDFDPDESAAAAPESAASAGPPAAPAAPAAPKAPAHTHSKALTREALALGFDPAEIDDTPPEDLRLAVRIAHERRDFDRRLDAPHRAAPAEHAAVAHPAPAEPAAPALAWGDDADAVIDPDLRRLIDAAVAPLLAEVRELRGLRETVGRLEGFERERVAEQQYSAIDRLFAALGAAYEPHFGKGARGDLDPAGPELARRQAVILMANHLAQAQGERADYAAAFRQAAQTLFGGGAAPAPAPAPAPAAPPRGENGRYAKPPAPAPEVEEWERAAVAQPTSRTPAPERGVAAAKRAFIEGARELNGHADDSAFE